MIWAGLPGQAARASTQALSAYWDQVDCAACHQEVVQQFARTRHGRAMEFGGWGKVNCQSCHGDTAAHVQTMDPEQVRNPTKLRLGEVIESCMSGHASGGHQQLCTAARTTLTTSLASSATASTRPNQPKSSW